MKASMPRACAGMKISYIVVWMFVLVALHGGRRAVADARVGLAVQGALLDAVVLQAVAAQDHAHIRTDLASLGGATGRARGVGEHDLGGITVPSGAGFWWVSSSTLCAM